VNNVIQSKIKERGQSMVELALTITFLFILLAGTIDLGRAFFTWLEMRDAAQEGASYGSICPNSGLIESRVRANLNPIYTYSVISNLPATPTPGSTITVNVSTNLPLTMPFLGTVLGSQTINIHATINDTILRSSCP
jgi:Flp pilus assembly protein TadG